MNVGGLFMGIIGCGYAIAAEALQALESAICIVGGINNFNVGMCYSNLCGDVTFLKIHSSVGEVAFTAGVVVGVNYMNLVNKFKNKRRKK